MLLVIFFLSVSYGLVASEKVKNKNIDLNSFDKAAFGSKDDLVDNVVSKKDKIKGTKKTVDEVEQEPVADSLDQKNSTQTIKYDSIANDDDRFKVCIVCHNTFEAVRDEAGFQDICRTPCEHLVHLKCLYAWQKIGKRDCPFCHEKINDEIKEPVEEKNIVFDFEKVQLKSFVEFISDLKEFNLIPNPDTANIETSLSIREPLTADQAYNVFLTVLEMSGFSHIKVGDVYKIVKKDARNTEPLPIFIGKASKDLPDSDRPVRFVTFLKNLAVSDVDPLLKSLLNQGSQVIQLQNLNGLVITDRCFNIKSAMRVINELDNTGNQEVVSLIRLKETNASEVKDFLDQLMKKADGSILAKALGVSTEGGIDYFPSGIKIISEDRTNTLVLMGPPHALQRVEDFITNFVDKGLKKVRSPFHIYECQYMDAGSLKQILDEVTKSDSTAGKFGGVRGGMKYFNSLKIEVDKYGNRLIVSCSDKNDWKYLYKTIVDLDKPQAQVSIETLMVEITSSDDKNLGSQIRNISDGSPIPGSNMQTSHLYGKPLTETLSAAGQSAVTMITNMVSLSSGLNQGTTQVSFGPKDSVWAILQALSSQVRISLINRPSITISNRATGTVSMASVKRITSEQAISDSSTAQLVGYDNATAETKISYQPQINQEGLVNLKVDLSFTDFGASAENIISKALTTNVTVADGQVMVMGGFVKTKASETLAKTPILSGIPILGWLFKNKGRHIEKAYTFFFVVTTIQKPRSTPGINLYTKMKLHQAHDAIVDTVDTAWGKDPVHNWFFNSSKEDYNHKVIDFSNARYQPTTVDYKNDMYYRSNKTVGDNDQDPNDTSDEMITFMPDGQKKVVRNYAVNPSAVLNDGSIIRLSQNSTKSHDDLKREKLRQLVQSSSFEMHGSREKQEQATPTSLGLSKETKREFENFLSQNHRQEQESEKKFMNMLSGYEEQSISDSHPEKNSKSFYKNNKEHLLNFLDQSSREKNVQNLERDGQARFNDFLSNKTTVFDAAKKELDLKPKIKSNYQVQDYDKQNFAHLLNSNSAESVDTDHFSNLKKNENFLNYLTKNNSSTGITKKLGVSNRVTGEKKLLNKNDNQSLDEKRSMLKDLMMSEVQENSLVSDREKMQGFLLGKNSSGGAI